MGDCLKVRGKGPEFYRYPEIYGINREERIHRTEVARNRNENEKNVEPEIQRKEHFREEGAAKKGSLRCAEERLLNLANRRLLWI